MTTLYNPPRPSAKMVNRRIAALMLAKSIVQDGSAIAAITPAVTTDMPTSGAFSVCGWVSFPTDTGDTDQVTSFDSDVGGFTLYTSPTAIGGDRKGVAPGAGVAGLSRSNAYFFAYVRATDGTAKIFRDGVSIPLDGVVYPGSGAADANGYNFVGQYISRAGTKAGVRFARLAVLNFAPTDAEVYDLHVNRLGLLPAEWRTASMTSLNASAFVSDGYGAAYGYTTFTGASATGFTAAGNIDCVASGGSTFSTRKGQRFLIRFTAAGSVSGNKTIAIFGNYFQGGAQTAFAVSVGGTANSIVLTASDNRADARVVFITNAGANSYTISNLSVIPVGGLWAMDDADRGVGPVIGDVSENGKLTILPGDGHGIGGVLRAMPAQSPGVQKFSVSGTGNRLIGGVDVRRAPVGWRVVGVQTDLSVSASLTIGTTSGGTDVVASVNPGTGRRQLTLAQPCPDPSRLWISGTITGDVYLTFAP